jgi:hypothetical protein
MRKSDFKTIQSFTIELAAYALFVVGYFLLVLHFLGGWLKYLFDGARPVYATVALALMVVQAVGLEFVTRRLVEFVRRKL